LRCLEKLNAEPEVVTVARRHAQGVTDYYSPAIASGYIKGCINHMRSMSGVPLMPVTYVRLLGLGLAFPGRSFLSSPDIASSVKELWLEVIEPQAKTFIAACAARGEEFSHRLSRDQSSDC
jgi:hypothetical protein